MNSHSTGISVDTFLPPATKTPKTSSPTDPGDLDVEAFMAARRNVPFSSPTTPLVSLADTRVSGTSSNSRPGSPTRNAVGTRPGILDGQGFLGTVEKTQKPMGASRSGYATVGQMEDSDA